MSKGFTPTMHPVLAMPTPAQALAMGEAQWRTAMGRREEIIRAERTDPFRHCWEPPIWKVCDCLMGFPWVPPELGERVRSRLGFAKAVQILLINGGQRGGKSQYAGNRTMRLLRIARNANAATRAWALHSTLQMSRDYQQPIFYNYLPAELRAKDIKSATTYIAYKQKTGFSEEKFVLPPSAPGMPGNDILFKAYEQDVRSIEGGNLDIVWCDELVPVDWVRTLELRIAEKTGWMIITFTPIEGYTQTVAQFQNGARVALESTAYLCPKDGGEPEVARALGLTEAELEELGRAAKENRAALYPQSRPEEFSFLQTSEDGGQRSDGTEGREFETVPRVLACADGEGKRAVVFFHSSDNPYGNPKNVWATISGKPRDFVRERFYGIAHKQFVARFPKFSRAAHVIAPALVPRDGTNYQVVDPSSGRNFCMLWFRVTPEHVYVYREWPGNYYIKGVGVPGPWALPDGKRPDGRPGPAQNTFGWGLRDYKEQIAELEGWKDQAQPGPILTAGQQTPDLPPADSSLKPVQEWDEQEGAAEVIHERYLDSRFASAPKMDGDRPTTLLTDFEEWLLFFTPTPGGPINEGVQKINDLLNYDTEKPVDFFNSPRLLISSDCENLIFALQTWTGRDGEKGACKDPIDCLHYFATADCGYLGDEGGAEEEDERDNYY